MSTNEKAKREMGWEIAAKLEQEKRTSIWKKLNLRAQSCPVALDVSS